MVAKTDATVPQNPLAGDVGGARGAPPSQGAIRRWFDRTYGSRGLGYLRPAEFYAIFVEYLELRAGERLLDVGCGPGLLLGEAVRRGADARGLDLSLTALGLARRRLPGARVQVGNAEGLCFADDCFDHVTCIGTLEHFLDPDRALGEMRRVLKPGGRLCVMVPNSSTLSWQLEGELLRRHDRDSHERAATLAEWRALFLRNGWTIDDIRRDEWPAYRRRRLLGLRRNGFVASSRAVRHLVPLRFADQFVFLLRR